MKHLQNARGTIRLIAFDLDGTLLDSQKQVRPRTKEALRQAARQGIRLVPATGRLLSEVPDSVLPGIPELSYAVTGNGVRIYRLPEKEVLHSRELCAEDARKILEECRQYKVMLHVGRGDSGVLDNQGAAWQDRRIRDELEEIAREWGFVFSDTIAELATYKDLPNKLTLNFADPAELAHATRRFSQWPEVSLSSSEPMNIELMPPNTSKGSAIAFLAEREGLEPHQIMAIGDSPNDKDMLMAAGLGVAMGNAVKELREIADAVTSSCDEDGVALAIEAIL